MYADNIGGKIGVNVEPTKGQDCLGGSTVQSITVIVYIS